jgi:SAM-dependent methyltransferase
LGPGLLRELGVALGSVLDGSCGVGTQAIGLAQAGYRVTATDISPTSVERCAREAGTRGLDIATAVADLRVLDVDGSHDAVVTFDNACAPARRQGRRGASHDMPRASAHRGHGRAAPGRLRGRGVADAGGVGLPIVSARASSRCKIGV